MSDSADVHRLPPMSAYEVRSPGIQFPLITLFLITALLSIFFASIRLFGFTGMFIFADLVILTIGIANLLRIRTALGVRIPKVTVAEFGVLLFVCFVLHGVSMPAVQSNCHPRRATGGTTTVNGAPAGKSIVAE